MFDIGWSELLIIGIVALIAIGPKELPNVLRTVGQYMGKVRRMAAEFQGQFQEAMREAEMADIKKQVDELSEVASGVTNFDPVGKIEKEFQSAIDDKPAETSSATATPGEPAPPAQDATAQAVTQDNAQENAHDIAQANAPAAMPAGPWPEPETAVPPQPKAGSGA